LKMKLKKKDKKTNNDEEIIDKLRELNDWNDNEINS
jgi:hypothetical protein